MNQSLFYFDDEGTLQRNTQWPANQRRITVIAACDKANGIGYHNAIPWHIPEDFAHFKRLTEGYPIIMGRKTYESLPINKTTGKRTLPNRQHFVITSDAHFNRGLDADADITPCQSLVEAIYLNRDKQMFIIGGQQVYEQAVIIADDIILTTIDHEFPCDRFFPSHTLPYATSHTSRTFISAKAPMNYRYSIHHYEID